jgi:hypothetical protein
MRNEFSGEANREQLEFFKDILKMEEKKIER